MRPHSDPIRELFSSRALYATLALFFDYPCDPLHARLIARVTDTDIKGVVRQLRRLEALGILRSRAWGKEKHYRLNEAFELHEELAALFEKSRKHRRRTGTRSRGYAPDDRCRRDIKPRASP